MRVRLAYQVASRRATHAYAHTWQGATDTVERPCPGRALPIPPRRSTILVSFIFHCGQLFRAPAVPIGCPISSNREDHRSRCYHAVPGLVAADLDRPGVSWILATSRYLALCNFRSSLVLFARGVHFERAKSQTFRSSFECLRGREFLMSVAFERIRMFELRYDWDQRSAGK